MAASHKVIKRNGEMKDFCIDRIINAISKAMINSKEGSLSLASDVANDVYEKLTSDYFANKENPTVEKIQDLAEDELMSKGFKQTAKHYITYRNMRTSIRKERNNSPKKNLPQEDEDKAYFASAYNRLVYKRTYAKWLNGRRETWEETINRYFDFMYGKCSEIISERVFDTCKSFVLDQKVMPSMRLLQFSGEAAENNNICAYNCSFIAPTCIKDFGEIIYILMCGVGVGFSVQKSSVDELGMVRKQKGKIFPPFVIPDSKEGWAEALIHGMTKWYEGFDVTFDYSELRPFGARLKTMGGKSSGPDPLRDLLDFTRSRILKRQGDLLRPIDVHDIICKIGDIVVCGGVRRSALISLSDLDDSEIRDCKTGTFYIDNPQRFLSNNSTVYMNEPDEVTLMKEWLALVSSRSGERGIFNRGSILKTIPERRVKEFHDSGVADDGEIILPVGTNPCGEIILRSKQFCNLTEVICRENDTLETLLEKIVVATILGTYQSTLVDFKGKISDEWVKNCKKERLLGVSMTGLWDCKEARKPEVLRQLKEKAIETNIIYAKLFGIEESTCITCVKPSGNVSQTVDCSSGMHPRFSPYYVRRVRISASDSLCEMMRHQGIPHHPEVGQTLDNATTFVFEFPIKSPESSVFTRDVTARDQLEFWKTVKLNFTEHNPSVTINVREDEWIEVLSWVKKNWDIVGGLSFLPTDDHIYALAPYQEITKEEYDSMVCKMEHLDFSKLKLFEKDDNTNFREQAACVGGVCERI